MRGEHPPEDWRVVKLLHPCGQRVHWASTPLPATVAERPPPPRILAPDRQQLCSSGSECSWDGRCPRQAASPSRHNVLPLPFPARRRVRMVRAIMPLIVHSSSSPCQEGEESRCKQAMIIRHYAEDDRQIQPRGQEQLDDVVHSPFGPHRFACDSSIVRH